LNTKSAELRFHYTHNYGDYALLSHVRGENEDMFGHIKSLIRLPIEEHWSHVSLKVKNCYEYAKDLGFEWVQIDTYCIGESCSAELLEAVNSMYRWYTGLDSRKCHWDRRRRAMSPTFSDRD
jgi:hypothetical protein